MFSNPTQAPTSYNLNVALSHSHNPPNGISSNENARDLEQAHRLGRDSASNNINQNSHQHPQLQQHQHQHHGQHQHEQQLFINQSHHLQPDGSTINNLTAATFFHQSVVSTGPATPASSSTTTAPTMTINQHQAHQSLAHLGHQAAHQTLSHQQHQQQHQLNQMVASHSHQAQYDHHQQLACVNVVNADNFTNHLASAGHVIFDQTNGLLRIGPHAGVLNAASNQAAIVVNTISELRQQHQTQQQTTIPTFAICDSNGVGNVGTVGLGANQYSSSSSNNCQSVASANSKSNHSSSGTGNGKPSTTDGVTSGLDANNNSRSVSRPAGETVANGSSKTSVGGGPGQCKGVGGVGVGGRKRKTSSKKSETSQSQGQVESGGSPRRTFACPTCNKGFTEKFNMKRHMQVHSQSRPKYICNECSKSFAWKDNFIRHKKAAHNTGVHPSFQI